MTEEQARAHHGVLAGTHRPKKDTRKPGGWATQNIEQQRAARRRHNDSEKGHAADERYELSLKRALQQVRHNAAQRGNG